MYLLFCLSWTGFSCHPMVERRWPQVNDEQPETSGTECLIRRMPVPGGSLFDKCGFKSLSTVLWAITLANQNAEIAAVGWRWPASSRPCTRRRSWLVGQRPSSAVAAARNWDCLESIKPKRQWLRMSVSALFQIIYTLPEYLFQRTNVYFLL